MTGPPGGRAAVLGSPIAHSLSPVLHLAAYRHLGLDWTFDAVEVTEPTLPAFVAGLDRSWRGLALTMPLKRAALALCDTVSPTARDVGGANTLVLDEAPRRPRPGRRVHGHNTDVPGLVAVLTPRLTGVRRVTVVGGGATATSAVAALARLGLPAPDVVVRDPARAADLLAAAARLATRPRLRPWSELTTGLAADLVVVTVPAPALAAAAALVGATVEPAGLLVDLVYDPWPTPLAAAWAASGQPVVGGLELLVEQATLQVQLMTGSAVPVALLHAAGQAALAVRQRGSG